MTRWLKRWHKLLLLLVGLGVVVYADVREFVRREAMRPTDEDFAAVLPEGVTVERGEGAPPHVVGRKGARVAGVACETARVEPPVIGYNAEIDLLVGVGPEGAVEQVSVFRHQETPAYMKAILAAGFLDQLKGHRLEEGLPRVDIVAGATITCEAMLKDVQTAGVEVATRVLGLELPVDTGEEPLWRKYLSPPVLVLAVVLLFAAAMHALRRFRVGRHIALGLGLVVVGFYLNTPVSLGHLMNLLALNPPRANNPLLLIILAFALVTPFFLGNTYCLFVCPFRPLQEWCYGIVHWRLDTGARALRPVRDLPRYLLFVLLLLFFLGGVTAVIYFEPFVDLFALRFTGVAGIYIAVVLIMSAMVKNFWCRFFCPTGACLDMLARSRLRRRRRIKPPGADRRTPSSLTSLS